MRYKLVPVRINTEKEVQSTKLVTEEEICGEIQSKRSKENVAGGCNK
jgi:hypothetical protein